MIKYNNKAFEYKEKSIKPIWPYQAMLIHSCNYIHTLDPTLDKYVHKIHDSVAGSLYNQNHFKG